MSSAANTGLDSKLLKRITLKALPITPQRYLYITNVVSVINPVELRCHNTYGCQRVTPTILHIKVCLGSTTTNVKK